MAVKLITEFGTYSTDADLETNFKKSVVLPSYETEQGVAINNHRYAKPCEYTIRGIVSTIPLGFTIDSFLSSITRHTSVRPATFIEAIIRTQANSKPFTVTAPFVTLRNMMIADIIWTHTAPEEASLMFEIKLQEFITVNKLTDLNEPTVEKLNPLDKAKSAISAAVQKGQVMVNKVTDTVKGAVNNVMNLVK